MCPVLVSTISSYRIYFPFCPAIFFLPQHSYLPGPWPGDEFIKEHHTLAARITKLLQRLTVRELRTECTRMELVESEEELSTLKKTEWILRTSYNFLVTDVGQTILGFKSCINLGVNAY
ncbi:unnamed protein product [Lepeophtheirus salmonis]|uniref:(salmon louse) hypothetical protein n=1 Tax=Lepeophtheirus salmonis TaxID=72036 RepID=A0A7R8CEJ0_LEPSM|nr:unnamed protein product [Lepeophtheirus salmonis]CAF2796463.1 unnamed protein product [Lepeophtheirus salmonis]